MLMRLSELEKALGRLHAYKSPYLGLSELAIILGLTKPNCSNRKQRGQLFEPLCELAMGPVWTKEQVLVWLSKEKKAYD